MKIRINEKPYYVDLETLSFGEAKTIRSDVAARRQDLMEADYALSPHQWEDLKRLDSELKALDRHFVRLSAPKIGPDPIIAVREV